MSVGVKFRRARSADIEPMTDLLTTLFSLATDFIIDKTRQQRGLEILLKDEDS
jgi:hypothetical protein